MATLMRYTLLCNSNLSSQLLFIFFFYNIILIGHVIIIYLELFKNLKMFKYWNVLKIQACMNYTGRRANNPQLANIDDSR